MANWYTSAQQWNKLEPWGGNSNLLLNSSGHAGTAVTITDNDITGPDGGTTGAKIADTAASSAHSFQATTNTFTSVSGVTYCFGARVKAGTHRYVQLTFGTAMFSGSGFVNFDLVRGIYAGSGSVSNYGMIPLGNDWYWCFMAVAATGSGTADALLYMVTSATAARGLTYVGTLTYLYADGYQVRGSTLWPGAYTETAGSAVVAPGGSIVVSVGDFRRQSNPSFGSERAFRCTTAGTTGATEPAPAGANPWAIGDGQTTADGTAVWTEITGDEAYQASNVWRPFARLATLAIAATGPLFASAAALGVGGTGYAVGDVVSVTAGTAHGDPTYLKVATLSGSAVATWTLLSGGSFAVLTAAASACTTITGAGSGATASRTSANYGVVAGDPVYVGDDHGEIQTVAMTPAFAGTLASPSKVLCVDSAGSVPPVSADLRATALLTTISGNALTLSGAIYAEGLGLNCGSGANTATLILPGASGAIAAHFKNCKFRLPTTNSSSVAVATASLPGGDVVWENCTLEVGATGSGISARGVLRWFGTLSAIAGTIFPTTLFQASNSSVHFTIEGVDLSALGSGATLVGALTQPGRIVFKDCKLGASVTKAATPTAAGIIIDFINCDSGDTHYLNERFSYRGTMTTETTIVRTGGASDHGVAVARKIVTTANSSWANPFVDRPVSIDVTDAMYAALGKTFGDAITVDVEGIWGGGAVPLNDDIWVEAFYPGTSGFPLGLLARSTKADILAAGANIPSSSATWGGSTTKFKKSVTITPLERGPISIVVNAAKASSTFYYCPKPVVS